MDSRVLALLCGAVLFGCLECACPDKCLCSGDGHVSCVYLGQIPTGLPETTLYLTLSVMGISEIPPDAFRETPNLKTLTITVSTIGRIRSCAFSGLPALKSLTLNVTTIGSIDSFAFNDLHDMTSIKVSYSKISKIDSYAFNNLRNIQEMELSVAEVKQVESFAYHNMQQVGKLSLWWLNITTMRSNAIANSSIQNLVLYQSFIKNLECGTFDVMKANISDNFSVLDSDLYCDCDISWMLQPAMKTLLGEALLKEVNCSNLSPWMPMSDLQPTDVHCPSYEARMCDIPRATVTVPTCAANDVWVMQNTICIMFALFCSFLVHVSRIGIW